MTTVLVTGASGVIGYGILRSLRRSGLPLRLVGTTIYDDSAAQGFCDVFERAVPTADPGYPEWLATVVARHGVAVVVPGIEADMYRWDGCRGELARMGVKPVLNDPQLIALCADKWEFYRELESCGADCRIDTALDADFDRLAARFGLPFLLKPRRGHGSKGILRVADRETFARVAGEVGPVLMAQPIVGTDAEEYSASVYGDGEGGAPAGMILRRRLARDGYTEKGEVAESPEIRAAIAALCRRFRPIGPTNFQFRMHGGAPRLLEINPRISSSTSMRAAFGYNESAMAVEHLVSGCLPVQPAVRRGRAVRYLEEMVYFE